MSPEEIKAALARPAVEFSRGGPRPTYITTKSWLGRVYLGRPGETLPFDAKGQPMWPLLQLVLAGLPAVPSVLATTQVLTVFISHEFPGDARITPNGQYWLLREYQDGEELVQLEMACPTSPLKSFPLQAGPVVADYPVWDGGGIPDKLANDIISLEDAGTISDYFEWVEICYGHKLGGWPSFCQPGIEFSPGFEFVLQIASNAEAQLNIVDGGTIFLAKNGATGEWESYCDFY